VKVTEIMSRPVITVLPETSVKDAAALLVQHGISALPVVDGAGDLIGIVSEADLVSIEARPDPRSQATPLPPTAGTAPWSVAEVMTRPVITIAEGGAVSQAARLMLEADVKRVPVVRNRKVVGIVSRRDLVKIIARHDQEVETEVARRLGELGLGMSRDAIKVTNGVATIPVARGETRRMRLAESVALGVPGVLEVRFAKANATRGRRSPPKVRAGS
jgi:CBS domain-containing protein